MAEDYTYPPKDPLPGCKGILEMVQRVNELRGDPEAAHVTEDDLYLKTLMHIAGGQCSHPHLCATLAADARFIEFPRWCA